MGLKEKLGSRDRLVRTALAGVLGLAAISSFRKGKRLSGVLAGGSALAIGYAARSEGGRLGETLHIESTDEPAQLHCAVCGEPIVPGQRRGPNAEGEIAHEACMEQRERMAE